MVESKSMNEPKNPFHHVYGSANKGITGVKGFMLDFNLMPVLSSLLLLSSRSTIHHYHQLMYRHLFLPKHVERRSVGTWLEHQMIKE